MPQSLIFYFGLLFPPPPQIPMFSHPNLNLVLGAKFDGVVSVVK